MNSISNRLLRSVMSVYLVLTLCIFALEVAIQYRQTREAITAELAMLQNTFHDSVSHALWHMDGNELDITIAGLLKMPSVSRVIATMPNGDVVRDLPSPDGPKHAGLMPAATFVNRHPILHDGTERLGWLEIQSNSNVIVDRLQTGVLFAALAAFVKTSILIFLVKKFFDRILSRPLYHIASLAGGIDPKDLKAQPLPVKPGPPDELDVISNAINGLAAEVASTVGALAELNKDLESQVVQRTALLQTAYESLDKERDGLQVEVQLRHARETELQRTNASLAESIDKLRLAQESLVEAEKMAALGGLVAGIAHEINTPVGLGLTGSSHFKYMVEQLDTKFRAGELEEPDFERFLADSKELSRSIFVSLEKAAALVRSFKLVAVDQGNDELRRFNALEYINDVVLTHHPLLRKARVTLTVECAPDLVAESFPGTWSQILSNLINNSVVHGFDGTGLGQPDPRIHVALAEREDELVLTYRDNGKGMPEQVAKKVFDPFFTTNRQGGGSGLGMHIVYNLVSQQLHGRITLHSEPDHGTIFTIRLPRNAPVLLAA
ncbi:hypothetical protein BH11PSE8_BH11PSE8_05460 [soil metagenome]